MSRCETNFSGTALTSRLIIPRGKPVFFFLLFTTVPSQDTLRLTISDITQTLGYSFGTITRHELSRSNECNT
jgi:hypothetical protein